MPSKKVSENSSETPEISETLEKIEISEKPTDKSTDKSTDKTSDKSADKSTDKSAKKMKPQFDTELSKKLVNDLLAGKKASKELTFTGLYGLGKSNLCQDIMKELKLDPEEGIIISSEHFLLKLPDSQKDLNECKKFYNTISTFPDESDITYSKCLDAQIKYGRSAWNLIFKDLYAQAKEKKLNILYEFTGRNLGMIKYLIPDLKALGYKIKIIYPISSNDNLYNKMFEYSKKYGLANNKTHLNTLVQESEKNIAEIYNLVDELYIYDVNNKPKKIFESINGKIKCTVDHTSLEGRSAEFKAFIEEKCGKTGSNESYAISDEDKLFLTAVGAGVCFKNSSNSIFGGCGTCGLKSYVLIIAVLCLIVILLAYENVARRLNIQNKTVFKIVGLLGIVVAIFAKFMN